MKDSGLRLTVVMSLGYENKALKAGHVAAFLPLNTARLYSRATCTECTYCTDYGAFNTFALKSALKRI